MEDDIRQRLGPPPTQDQNQTFNDTPESPPPGPEKQIKQKPFKPKKSKRPLLLFLLVLLLLGGAAYGGYWYANDQAAKSSNSQDDEIAALQKQVTDAKAETEAAKTASSTPSGTDEAAVEAAVKDKKYGDIQKYMAQKVNVIIAATEGLGERTPEQAVKDMDYLSKATNWNFNVTAGDLAKYHAGDYAQYFSDSALVGKSSNNYVVSFSFDSSGDISCIFMTNDAAAID